MSTEVGAGGRFDIFLDSVPSYGKLCDFLEGVATYVKMLQLVSDC